MKKIKYKDIKEILEKNSLEVKSEVSANEILVPLQTEFFALEVITQLVKTIDRIKVNLNPDLGIRGVLLTMFDCRLNLSSQVADEVRSFFKDKIFETVIHRNVRLSEAPSFGKPALLYDANSTGAQNYLSLVEEILHNGN